MNNTVEQFDSNIHRYVRDTPRITYAEPDAPWLNRHFISGLESVLGRPKLESLYHRLKAKPFDITSFFASALEEGDVQLRYDQRALSAIPRSGPLVFVANHPYGIIDGMIMCDLAAKTRGNFRVMLNSLLCQDRELAEYFLPIDFTENRNAIRNNIDSKNRALRDIANDIPVILFPSGMVSTADRFGFGSVIDGPWTTFAARLIREAEATVVPVYFPGRNSRWFHVASHIAEPLRMALLLREAVNKFNNPVDFVVGEPLYWETLEALRSRKALTEYLYQEVQALGDRVRV